MSETMPSCSYCHLPVKMGERFAARRTDVWEVQHEDCIVQQKQNSQPSTVQDFPVFFMNEARLWVLQRKNA